MRVARVNMDEHTIDFELVESLGRQDVPTVIYATKKGRKGGKSRRSHGGGGERDGRGSRMESS